MYGKACLNCKSNMNRVKSARNGALALPWDSPDVCW